MQTVSFYEFKKKFLKKPNTNKYNIPLKILTQLFEYKILDIKDENERARITRTILESNTLLQASTIQKYDKYLKQILYPTIKEPIKITYTKRNIICKEVNFEDIESFIKFLNTEILINPNYLNLCLKFCEASLLRINEVMQITTVHLINLLNRNKYISLHLKNNKTDQWRVKYTENFIQLLIIMNEFYKDEITVTRESEGVPIYLFSEGSSEPKSYTIRNYMHKKWTEWLKKIPSPGLGPHIFRYYYATKMYEVSNGNLYFVKDLLNHKEIKTTKYYLKQDTKLMKEELEQLANTDYKNFLL